MSEPLLRGALRLALLAATLGLVIAGVMQGGASPVAAQDDAPSPQPGVDFCLVSLDAEGETIKLGEPVRLWAWGVGVEPVTWNLTVEGTGAVALRRAGPVDSWAELIEWTVTGSAEGEVTFAVSMVCTQPGDGTDAMTLTVLPPEPTATSTPQPSADFCVTSLSLSDPEVRVGDTLYAWFVGAGAEPRSWRLNMAGDGSARVLTSRELDAQYVEWQLQAMEAGTLRLIGSMNCRQTGNGASVSVSEIVITDRSPAIWTPQTVTIIEAALAVVAVALTAVLIYLLIRRRRGR